MHGVDKGSRILGGKEGSLRGSGRLLRDDGRVRGCVQGYYLEGRDRAVV